MNNLFTVILMDISTEFKDFYINACSKEYPDLSPSPDKLRVSSFPYCGVRHLWQRCYQLVGDRSVAASYFGGVGILAHMVAQNQLGKTRRMFGSWECPDKDTCGGRRYFSNIHTCPKCQKPMNYIELNVSGVFPNLAMCMIDGIYRSDDGRYFVVDYKTTSTRYTVDPLIQYLPHKENVAQVEAYCALVEKKYNVEIAGWLLHYIARDNPFKSMATFSRELSDKEKHNTLLKIERYADQFHIVMNATSYKHVQQLVDKKPCRTYSEYHRNYSSYDGCPLANVCFESKRLREELQKAWKLREDDFLTFRRDKSLEIVKL